MHARGHLPECQVVGCNDSLLGRESSQGEAGGLGLGLGLLLGFLLGFGRGKRGGNFPLASTLYSQFSGAMPRRSMSSAAASAASNSQVRKNFRTDAPYMSARVVKYFPDDPARPSGPGRNYLGVITGARRIPLGAATITPASESVVPWELCNKFFKVEYEDGDNEELEEYELHKLIIKGDHGQALLQPGEEVKGTKKQQETQEEKKTKKTQQPTPLPTFLAKPTTTHTKAVKHDAEKNEKASTTPTKKRNSTAAAAAAQPPEKRRQTDKDKDKDKDKSAPSTSSPTATTSQPHVQEAAQLQNALKAFVYDKLITHFRDRSDIIPNVTSMNATGFCRNCLAKWYVQACKHNGVKCTYDEAQAVIYGAPYAEWKKAFHKPMTPAEIELFGDETRRNTLHAQHPPDTQSTSGQIAHEELVAILKGCAEMQQPNGHAAAAAVKAAMAAMAGPSTAADTRKAGAGAGAGSRSKPALLSDVCCEDDLACDAPAPVTATAADGSASIENAPLPSWAFPPQNLSIRLGVLTVSDRASRGEYKDESGPAIETSMRAFCKKLEAACAAGTAPASTGAMSVLHVERATVPDEKKDVVNALKALTTGEGKCDVVLTTGGTGLSMRDITPEATRAVIAREAPGLLEFAADARFDPNAALSRAVAGVTEGGTVIANLPGRPAAVQAWLSKLQPLLPHVINQVGGGGGRRT